MVVKVGENGSLILWGGVLMIGTVYTLWTQIISGCSLHGATNNRHALHGFLHEEVNLIITLLADSSRIISMQLACFWLWYGTLPDDVHETHQVLMLL